MTTRDCRQWPISDLGGLRQNATSAVQRFEFFKHHRDARSHENRDFSGVSSNFDPVCAVVLAKGSDRRLEPLNVSVVVKGYFTSPVRQFLNQKIALSVDGAPNGAVGGTSDSTERGLTPGSPEMKEPSAFATAEGDATNNPNR